MNESEKGVVRPSVKSNGKKLFPKPIIAIFAVIVVAGILGGCILPFGDTNNSSVEFDPQDVTPGEPYLIMKIVDYPKAIENDCQKVSFTIEMENVGDTTLKYDDFRAKYYLNIMSDDAVQSFDNFSSSLTGGVIASMEDYFDYGAITYRDMLSDFGEIEPGGKATVTYKSISYTSEDQHEYSLNNSFGHVGNGSYKYYMEFGKAPEENKILTTSISQSSTVMITTDVQEEGEGFIMAKYCEHEMITDESVDFYAE